MAYWDKIRAIKEVRGATGVPLLAAKRLVEALEEHYLDGKIAPGLEKAREAAARAECYREDLHSLVRLVDYFVAHPEEYREWKGQATTEEEAAL